MKPTCLVKAIPQSEGGWLLHLLTAIAAGYFCGRLAVDLDLEQLILYKAELEQLFRYSFLALESLWVDSHQTMTRVSLLSPEEATPLLAVWNTGATRRHDHRAIHEMFEEQAALSPDAFALVCGDEQLTYRELDQRANKLARYLRRKGIKPGTLAGLCLERSPEMIVGLLAILKAGGAYVPLDPQYPRDRLKMLMDDIQTPILLTEQDLAERVTDFGAELVCLDLASQVFEGESKEPLTSEVTGGDLAYVIYTSGSTGRPKGVEVTHGGLVNYIVHAADVCGLAPADRVLQFSSPSFDVAAEEIFCSLTRGATLVLRDDSMLSSVSDFLQACAKWGITVLDLPTAYWHEITARLFSEGLAMPDEIRLVIIGGERAIPERLAQWQARIGNRIRLFNSYGPTEATIAATLCELTGGIEGEKSFGEVSIGGLISNVQLYVSDQDLNPVPAGVPGELLIGGAGVARGYLKRPELTAEKFIPDPFSRDPNSRLYRTGDLVRFRPGGDLEFVGRIDYQVKIHGLRIETEEIETVLREDPRVWETVVIAREDTPGDKRLVAYVVPIREATLNSTELRSFMSTKLPHYMIPSAFVFIGALPLTPNGKIDRRALPSADPARPDLEQSYVAPRTPIEEGLARIWAEVLKLQRVGIHDNFFDIGGHSLNATQIVSRVREAFQVRIPLRSLFEFPTVTGLAATIIENRTETPEELAGILDELEALSDEEMRRMLLLFNLGQKVGR